MKPSALSLRVLGDPARIFKKAIHFDPKIPLQTKIQTSTFLNSSTTEVVKKYQITSTNELKNLENIEEMLKFFTNFLNINSSQVCLRN